MQGTPTSRKRGVTPASPCYFETEEAFMRRILPLAITFAALSLSITGVRADGTWCAHYGTGLEGMNCGFYSFEQCRATVSGVGGFCQANIFPAREHARRPPARHAAARQSQWKSSLTAATCTLAGSTSASASCGHAAAPALAAMCQTPDSCSAANSIVYSMTSSARASSCGGTSVPSALAVLRLITSSYFVGACTGRSAGFSPLRMRST
jgi:hypothetical protein